MKFASLLLQGFAQPVEVSLVVFLAKKAGFAVVSALNDVQGYAMKVNSGAAGHKRTLAEIFEPGPFDPLILFNPPQMPFQERSRLFWNPSLLVVLLIGFVRGTYPEYQAVVITLRKSILQ